MLAARPAARPEGYGELIRSLSVPEKVGAKLVARNPGFLLDLINARQRDRLLRPSGDGCLVDFALTREVGEAKPLGFQKVS